MTLKRIILSRWVLSLARIFATLGYYQEVPDPNISTKAMAREYTGSHIKDYNKEKKIFLETIIPCGSQLVKRGSG
jgi:hypothetical protein